VTRGDLNLKETMLRIAASRRHVDGAPRSAFSRAVLVARLRELEDHGVIERRPRGADGAVHEYWLTPAGEGLRVVMHALRQWGMTYTHDRIKRSDLDPALLIWGLRKRVDLSTLPDRRVVLRFEFQACRRAARNFESCG
jgi:DNA-binding HxlR family transcriptional regulator